jgi:hypothetical protein
MEDDSLAFYCDGFEDLRERHELELKVMKTAFGHLKNRIRGRRQR